MPEGDTYVHAARRLRPVLVGKQIDAVEGVPGIRRRAASIVGSTVDAVRTHGKHLFIDLSSGLTIHTWLGMPGIWRVYDRGARWREDPGAARLVLETDDHVAVCFSAPTVEIERRRVIDHRLRHLGPDLLDPDLDLDEVRRRLSLLPPDLPLATALLDQRVVAGIGNEYACEALFLEGRHPSEPMGSAGVATALALIARARRLMIPNLGRRGRVTTGNPHQGSWVFERTGRPCRRCGRPIASGRVGGDQARIAYWCPRCQSSDRERSEVP